MTHSLFSTVHHVFLNSLCWKTFFSFMSEASQCGASQHLIALARVIRLHHWQVLGIEETSNYVYSISNNHNF